MYLYIVLIFIIHNYNKKIQLKECADLCLMSESNFTKKFNKTIGMNFNKNIRIILILHCSQIKKAVYSSLYVLCHIFSSCHYQ